MNADNKNGKVSRITTHNKEYKIVNNGSYDPYWDEGVNYYPRYRRGRANEKKKRRLMTFQVRRYKTWKHNRNTQWKEYGHRC